MREKVYIAGRITGLPCYKKEFSCAQEKLQRQGASVMNPAILPAGFTHRDYMHVCFAMIDVCERVHFLDGWQESVGAMAEHDYATCKRKKVTYETPD